MKETLFRLKNIIGDFYQKENYDLKKIFPIILEYFTEALISSSPDYKSITYDLDGGKISFYRSKYPLPIPSSETDNFFYINPSDGRTIEGREWNEIVEKLNPPIGLRLLIEKDKEDPYHIIITWYNPSILMNSVEIGLKELIRHEDYLYEFLNKVLNNMEADSNKMPKEGVVS